MFDGKSDNFYLNDHTIEGGVQPPCSLEVPLLIWKMRILRCIQPG